MTPRVLPAVLGWTNPDRDRENLRVYALDAGPSPRWNGPAGRVAEQALRERGGHEGDRLLIVELDRGRWVTDGQLAVIGARIAALLARCPACLAGAHDECLAFPTIYPAGQEPCNCTDGECAGEPVADVLDAVRRAHDWGCDCTPADPCRVLIALDGGPATPTEETHP